ncbi:MAG: elongation factor 1-beta [Candidatus Aenigmarchaeota archaeon]|nr:elongation factor 1-beta [Candidatus Aenigmarchaeota archaeon]
MGLVAATFKLMPEDAETNLEEVKKEIHSKMQVRQIKEIPIAFGIKILEVLLVFEDKEGIGSVEEKLRGVKGVSSVESGDVTLL